MTMMAQLQFRDLTLGYDRHPAVHHLSGDVAPGALLAVVGPNGAGKSTLFRGIVGLLKPLAGTIAGLKPREIAYLPQIADIDRSFPISVFDFVSTGLWRTTGIFGGIGAAARQKIAQAIAVGVHHGDVVGFAGEVFGEGAADLTGTEDDDLHAVTPERQPSAAASMLRSSLAGPGSAY